MQETITGSTITPETPALFPEVQETVTGGAISETISGSAIRCYTYDNFNRLISYQSGDTFAFYSYDAEDYRITKQVMDSDGEKFTRYFYEGNHVVLEADESGKITAHNTYSINLIGRTVGEEGYYYFYNAHGDVVKLIGIQSEEEILYRYDAFGTLVEVTGDADNSITYAGYQYDKESGLYYLNARYYDSTTARFLTEDTYAGKANDPLSLHRYTYCANNPLRYTDPDGHFFGALFRFVAGAVVGAVTEYVTQKFIEKRDKINVKAIVYEGVVGGVTSVIGGVGGAAKKAEKTVKAVKSAKTVVKSAVKTGVKEAAGEFLHDVGYQVFAEDKSLADVDYGQAIKAGADSGISAMVGELDDAFGSKKQLSATNRKKASQATGLIDDAADAPRPRTNALPDVEVTPSRGAVKNAAGGLADAGVGTGNIGRKSNTTTLSKDKLKNAKKSSPSLSKNQQKMQSQTVGSTLSGNTDLVPKNNKNSSNADLGNKLDYLFGKASGDKHNIERSKAMQAELQKIGIHNTPSGKEYISNHLNDVLKDPTNISNVETRSYTIKELPDKPVVKYTATTRESLLMGPGGAVMVKSIWNGNRLLTAIVEGGKRK